MPFFLHRRLNQVRGKGMLRRRQNSEEEEKTKLKNPFRSLVGEIPEFYCPKRPRSPKWE